VSNLKSIIHPFTSLHPRHFYPLNNSTHIWSLNSKQCSLLLKCMIICKIIQQNYRILDKNKNSTHYLIRILPLFQFPLISTSRIPLKVSLFTKILRCRCNRSVRRAKATLLRHTVLTILQDSNYKICRSRCQLTHLRYKYLLTPNNLSTWGSNTETHRPTKKQNGARLSYPAEKNFFWRYSSPLRI
jgi:hypothetical protein